MKNRWTVLGLSLAVLLVVVVGVIVVQKNRYTQSLDERSVSALDSLSGSRQVVVDLNDTTDGPTELAQGLAEMDLDLTDEHTLLVVNRLPGDDYERLTLVRADGSRVLLPISCARAHAAAGSLLCMEPRDSVIPTWEAVVFDLEDPNMGERVRRPAALPSRARVQPTGDYIAYTEFITGHEYATSGEFSTRTVVYGLADDDLFLADDMLVSATADRFAREDGNWWGVSFLPDGSGDYTITYGSQDTVEILKYDERRQASEPIGAVGSCPSVSPDGRFMVYKRIDFDRAVLGEETSIELVVHDLLTGDERLLGEDRFVDDQVEWLDNETIVYAVQRDEETVQPAWDVWSLDLDPRAEPVLLVPFADSPSVYRDFR